MAKKKLSPKQMKNTKGGAAAAEGRLGKVVASKPDVDVLATDTSTTAEALLRKR